MMDWRAMTDETRDLLAREQRIEQREACKRHLLSVLYGGGGIARPEGISGPRWSAMIKHYAREVGVTHEVG